MEFLLETFLAWFRERDEVSAPLSATEMREQFKVCNRGHFSELAAKLELRGSRGRSLLCRLQMQTLPPVVISWPVHQVHVYYGGGAGGAHTNSQTQNTTLNGCVHVFQSAAAAPSPVMGNMPPNDAMPGGPMPPGFFQVCLPLSVTALSSPPSIPPYNTHTLLTAKCVSD